LHFSTQASDEKSQAKPVDQNGVEPPAAFDVSSSRLQATAAEWKAPKPTELVVGGGGGDKSSSVDQPDSNSQTDVKRVESVAEQSSTTTVTAAAGHVTTESKPTTEIKPTPETYATEKSADATKIFQKPSPVASESRVLEPVTAVEKDVVVSTSTVEKNETVSIPATATGGVESSRVDKKVEVAEKLNDAAVVERASSSQETVCPVISKELPVDKAVKVDSTTQPKESRDGADSGKETGLSTAEPVKVNEPVKVAEAVKVPEPVKVAAEPVKVAAEPVKIPAEPVKIAEPVKVDDSGTQPESTKDGDLFSFVGEKTVEGKDTKDILEDIIAVSPLSPVVKYEYSEGN